MVNYEWQFPALDVKFSDGEMKNVVTTVHWVLVATEGEHSTSVYGSVGVPEPTPEAFVSYEDLTQEEVISWVEAALNESGEESQLQAMKDGLVSQIETMKAPVTATLTPPWNVAPEVIVETDIIDEEAVDEPAPEVVVDSAGEEESV